MQAFKVKINEVYVVDALFGLVYKIEREGEQEDNEIKQNVCV